MAFVKMEDWIRMPGDRLLGVATGHPNYPGKHEVLTTPVVSEETIDGKVIATTRSGTQYWLVSKEPQKEPT